MSDDPREDRALAEDDTDAWWQGLVPTDPEPTSALRDLLTDPAYLGVPRQSAREAQDAASRFAADRGQVQAAEARVELGALATTTPRPEIDAYFTLVLGYGCGTDPAALGLGTVDFIDLVDRGLAGSSSS